MLFVSVASFHALVRNALVVGLMCQALTSLAETIIPPPPTLEQKVRQATVILAATLGEVRYYQWSIPIPGVGPRISKIPADGFDAYVNLTDVKILYGNEDAVLIDRKSMNRLPLWAHQNKCFTEEREVKLKLPPKGERFIFFFYDLQPTSIASQVDAKCLFKSVPIEKLPVVRERIHTSKKANQ